MPGKWFEQLFEVAAGQYGYVTTADAHELGADHQVLVDMQRHGHLERRGHGLYRFNSFPVGPHDQLMEATLWPRGLGAISHDSALDLWNLCDVNPSKIHITVPKSARIRRQVPKLYVVHERELPAEDFTVEEGITVVTARRAILDGLDRHLDGRLIRQAVDNARARGLVSEADLADIEKNVA